MLPNLSNLAIGSKEGAVDPIEPNREFEELESTADELLKTLKIKLSFTVENPGPSKRPKSLFVQPYTLEFLKLDGVRTIDTSYCKYGEPFRKDTTFITNLEEGFCLERRCEGRFVCTGKKRNRTHDSSVQDVSNPCSKNAIPERLLHELLAAFVYEQALLGCREFHVIDCFSGWESFRRACETFKPGAEAFKRLAERLSVDERTSDMALWLKIAQRPVTYSGFDAQNHRTGTEERVQYVPVQGGKKRVVKQTVVKTDPLYVGDFLEMPDMLPKLVAAEALAIRERARSPKDKPIAVLLHASPPCTTFSQAALYVHRPSGEPLSELAVRHDELVKKLLSEIAYLTRTLQEKPQDTPETPETPEIQETPEPTT